MREKDIIIGEKYRIVGTKGGCERKCIDCNAFKNHIVTAKKVLDTGYDSVRTVRIISTDGEETNCHVCPEDLEPLAITNWKQKIGGKND